MLVGANALWEDKTIYCNVFKTRRQFYIKNSEQKKCDQYSYAYIRSLDLAACKLLCTPHTQITFILCAVYYIVQHFTVWRMCTYTSMLKYCFFFFFKTTTAIPFLRHMVPIRAYLLSICMCLLMCLQGYRQFFSVNQYMDGE